MKLRTEDEEGEYDGCVIMFCLCNSAFCSLQQGEDIDADRIFVTSSMQEAMYLLEHCTNLAIGNVSGKIWHTVTHDCISILQAVAHFVL